MRVILLCLILIWNAKAATWDGLAEEWDMYKQHHDLHHDVYDDARRLGIYLLNRARIEEYNNRPGTHKLGITPFMHLTPNEFKRRVGLEGPRLVGTTSSFRDALTGPTAESFDWRNIVDLGPISNQGKCSTCWAFTAATAVETCLAHKGQPVPHLSIEEQLQCTRPYGNKGCVGGLPEYTFRYIKDHGLTTATVYPYTGIETSCRSGTPRVAQITGFVEVSPNNPIALMTAVNINPVVVCIEADASIFQFYKGGIISDIACGTNWDHAVLVIGYGTNAEGPYWIIRNSWGTQWGENGYGRIKRDLSSGPGICGINMKPSYPTC